LLRLVNLCDFLLIESNCVYASLKWNSLSEHRFLLSTIVDLTTVQRCQFFTREGEFSYKEPVVFVFGPKFSYVHVCTLFFRNVQKCSRRKKLLVQCLIMVLKKFDHFQTFYGQNYRSLQYRFIGNTAAVRYGVFQFYDSTHSQFCFSFNVTPSAEYKFTIFGSNA